MNLLLYTHAFAPKRGGVETVVMSLARGLTGQKGQDGGERHVLTLVTRSPRDKFDDAALPFRVIRRPSLPQLLSLIRSSDLLHVAGPAFLPMLAALILRKPIVVEHHGFQAICPNGQMLYTPEQRTCPGHFMAGRHRECLRCNAGAGVLASLKQWALTFPRRWICMRAERNITPTNWLAALLRLPRMSTVYHGVPTSFANVVVAPSPGVFAFVGRLVSTKGVATLLEAAEKLNREGLACRIKIIGDGPCRAGLEQSAAGLGVATSVHFLGDLPADRLEQELRDASTVVMPSLAGEVFGMVAVESMARGKALIASDIGALREVIGDAGLLFSPGDVAALAARMRQILTDESLAASFRSRARQRAGEQFNLEESVSQHLAIYRESIQCQGA